MSGFKKAVKVKLNGRVALCGVSGSGKTMTALKIARGISPNGRVAVIDSERGSASKYADIFDFDVLELDSFHPNTYIKAIGDAKGYDVLVIDSLSHAWMGKDGALEQVDKVAARMQSKNSFTAWREVTPLHNALVEAILSFPGHVIVTMRSKSEYVMETNEKGKQMPVKVGLAPIQRDGIEFEFDLVADMDLNNTMIVTKTRDPQFRQAVIPLPDEKVGAAFAGWLNSGEARNDSEQKPASAFEESNFHLPPIDDKQRTNRRNWRATVNKAGMAAKSLDDIQKAVTHYEEKLGPMFDSPTYHNQTETYRSLLAEHSQRIQAKMDRESPEGIKKWVSDMQQATAKDFDGFVKGYQANTYLQTVEVEQELQDKAKALGFQNYADAVEEVKA